jgi:putative ABC transport system ATP-binding protein
MRTSAQPITAGDADGTGVLAVQARGVTKAFGRGRAVVQALRGVDLDIPTGQLVMLVGPSGCGKTTLVSIASGVLDADSGSMKAFGVDWADLTNDQKTIRRGELVGFVFQQFNLIPTLTAVQNVAVPLLVRCVHRHAAIAAAAEGLAAVGIGDRLHASPAELSGGQQQRVAIARALVGRPRLLICDEPTANLDARSGQSVLELIHGASRETAGGPAGQGRCAVIVVTHDARIFHYADEIHEMEDGLVKSAPSEHIMEEARHVPHYDPEPPGGDGSRHSTNPKVAPPGPRTP